LPRVVTQPRPGRGSNPRPLGRKSDAVPLRHHATRGPGVPGKILTSCRNSDSERPHSCCHLANKVYIRPIGRKPQIRALRLTCARYQVFVCMFVCMYACMYAGHSLYFTISRRDVPKIASSPEGSGDSRPQRNSWFPGQWLSSCPKRHLDRFGRVGTAHARPSLCQMILHYQNESVNLAKEGPNGSIWRSLQPCPLLSGGRGRPQGQYRQ